MSSKGIIKPSPRLNSVHNLRSTKQTTSLNPNKAAKPIKIDRLSSLPSELILLVFEHLRTRPGIRLNCWTTAILSKSLRPFQQLNLYFSIDIDSVERLTSLCDSLQVSQLGNMIKHFSFRSRWRAAGDEDVLMKALPHLAQLVPLKFTILIYKQAIEVIYECDMQRRIDDSIEEMGEDPFEEEMEEMIEHGLNEAVADFYHIDTDSMVDEMVMIEKRRVRREEGLPISYGEAQSNLTHQIEAFTSDRRDDAARAIEADLRNPLTMIEMRKRHHDFEADHWRTYYEDEERCRLKTGFTNDIGEDMMEEATSRAMNMFQLEKEGEDGD